MSMDLDAIQQMFFQESEEGLQSLEACFALCGEGGADGETINTIFRAVHSIKGGAGAFGHEALQTFAHHYEHVLDQLRSGSLGMTPALLDVLLAAFDTLSDHVSAARGERGAPDDGAVLAQLAAAADHSETSRSDESAPVAIHDAPQSAQADDFDALLSLLEPGASPKADPFDDLMSLLGPSVSAPEPADWWVAVTPGADAFDNGSEPLLLLRELCRMGATDVTLDAGRVPGIDDIEPERSYLGWRLSLPGSVARDDIEAVFEFVAGWDVRILLAAVDGAYAQLDRISVDHDQAKQAQAKLAALSEREKTVLHSLVHGLSNKQIAFDLEISPRTVEYYRANVMTKLDVASLSEALRLAFRGGMFPV